MKRLMPFDPGGASGSRASTRWTMFSPMSWSPPLIHIFDPKMRKPPSASGIARVAASPTELPAWGSEMHIVPKNRPSSSGRAQRSTCSPSAVASSVFAAATLRNAYPVVATFAARNHALQAAPTV
jgi:hypothetical protein